jgi:hypothetical protein
MSNAGRNFSLKGCKNPAQGNALGKGPTPKALKGRKKKDLSRSHLRRLSMMIATCGIEILVPFQGVSCFFLRVPRVLPWAGFFDPFGVCRRAMNSSAGIYYSLVAVNHVRHRSKTLGLLSHASP